MLRSQQFLLDGERAAVQCLRFRQLALCLFERGQIVQVDGDFIMLRAVCARENLQRASVQRFGFVILLLSIKQRGQRGQIGGGVYVIGAERVFPNFDRPARELSSQNRCIALDVGDNADAQDVIVSAFGVGDLRHV